MSAHMQKFNDPSLPSPQGLYDPSQEHENCGVGFLCHLKGQKSHSIIEGVLEMCRNMDHRGGCGCDPDTGDGAGVFFQLPHKFFKTVGAECGIDVPDEGQYAVGTVFLSKNAEEREECERIYAEVVAEEGQVFLGWRDVPVRSELLGKASAAREPVMRQIFIGRGPDIQDADHFERRLYVIRRRASMDIRYRGVEGGDDFYTATLSARTMVYKGMLTTGQLSEYFPDLHHPDMETAMALVHSRFSTNTFPSWPRAQPYRYMCHNGEINTVRGNENWVRAREQLLKSELLGKDLDKVLPIVRTDGSDSAKFDNCLELLVLAGRPLHQAVMMMIPEPWERHDQMLDAKRAFYEYHACMMEPWDGPASIAFSDGVSIGAVLDRNGLRPSRYYVTEDDLVIMASEVGVLKVDPAKVVKKGRLEPGRMFLVDTNEGRIIPDQEIKEQVAQNNPYEKWLNENRVFFKDLPEKDSKPALKGHELTQFQRCFGYTFEDLRFTLGPTAESGNQPLGSMGNDAPLAVFSERPQLLYSYFKQLFAQVTNPAIDPIREELVTSSITFLGSESDLLHPGPENCRMIRLESPIIGNQDLARLRKIDTKGFRATTLPILFRPEMNEPGLAGGLLPGKSGRTDMVDMHKVNEVTGRGLERAMNNLFDAADAAIREGTNLLILSDRKVDNRRSPIPALMAVAGLHHHLIRRGKRSQVSIILESAEPREVHHFAVLLGYGVDAINPYLAIDSIQALIDNGELTMDYDKAVQNYLKGSIKGVIKTMSKMGISTVASYRGAQIFEAIGISSNVIDRYFTWTASRVEGIGMDVISREVKLRHDSAFKDREVENDELDPGGAYQWRKGGERHLFSPEAIHLLQKAARLGSRQIFSEYSRLVDDQSRDLYTLRGLMEFNYDPKQSVPLEEVESVESIFKRFKSGAMSYGSISKETHESLAIAMNRLGGKSNTGEGGEDYERFKPMPNGDSKRSAIKQVASGRFGVTSYYLVNSDELQIKVCQGAKPGEGGELPGAKVFPEIARVRGTTPGVGLISPPPHHDIYSIEDLAELIHDLKNANYHARVNVKLVSAVGVGTIAAGVAKAKADVILISGYDGGTGASPRSSIQHAGCPWELGLAETHQTLLLNDLRSRVVVETDGQLKTGRDVAIACMLGAEEFGFATGPLVSLGCLMMRVCHKNTCPVGIATQNETLRKNFGGAADHVVNFMTFVAEELREVMAKLGFRTINEMVGRTDRLNMRAGVEHYKAKGLDYSKLLYCPKLGPEVGTYCQMKQDHGIEKTLDMTTILPACKVAIENGEKVKLDLPIVNTDRVAGTITGSEISRQRGPDGLPDGTIHIKFSGCAGQSLGAFTPKGMTLEVEGDTNDYCGKGLSGGLIVVYPPRNAHKDFVADESIIVGNTCFYGATAGEAFIAGVAGERFCVRNSGVHAVIEGVGDHGCEYMTGGSVVVLGRTGRNFAAGMSGGTAYVYDPKGVFAKNLNAQMVNLYQLIECEDEEIQSVRERIEKHVEWTNSVKGKAVLSDWENARAHFVKVLPSDYERVLLAQKKARESGLSGEQAVVAAFEENAKIGH